jgi:hypothetical protein
MPRHEPGPAPYDGFADTFAAEASGSAYNALYDRPTVLDLLGDVRGRQVLDGGCGPGLYMAELGDREKPWEAQVVETGPATRRACDGLSGGADGTRGPGPSHGFSQSLTSGIAATCQQFRTA